MRDRYIAFDVETPNYANNRMSAIGVAVTENGEIADEFYMLVNPEVHFDRFNFELTGITPGLVADAPVFPELWTELEGLMDSGLLVAHNAPFDMSVLAKCLRDYGIRWHPRVEYACTCQMGRRLLPQLSNHKLNTLCDYLETGLDHHHAGSDSRAYGEILLHYLRSGADVERFVCSYDMTAIRTAESHSWYSYGR